MTQTLKEKSEFSKSCPLKYENGELYEVSLTYIGDIIKTEDVKKAVLKFEKILINRTSLNSEEDKYVILRIHKEIFGDFKV